MATDDSFRARLDSMIVMCHPLAVLATRMPWAQIEVSLAPLLAHKVKRLDWLSAWLGRVTSSSTRSTMAKATCCSRLAAPPSRGP